MDSCWFSVRRLWRISLCLLLNHSSNNAVLQSMAREKCLLTTPSLLSSGTQFKSLAHPPVRQKRVYV